MKLRLETADLAQVSSQLSEARGEVAGLCSQLAVLQTQLGAAKAEIQDAKLCNESFEKQVRSTARHFTGPSVLQMRSSIN